MNHEHRDAALQYNLDMHQDILTRTRTENHQSAYPLGIRGDKVLLRSKTFDYSATDPNNDSLLKSMQMSKNGRIQE